MMNLNWLLTIFTGPFVFFKGSGFLQKSFILTGVFLSTGLLSSPSPAMPQAFESQQAGTSAPDNPKPIRIKQQSTVGGYRCWDGVWSIKSAGYRGDQIYFKDKGSDKLSFVISVKNGLQEKASGTLRMAAIGKREDISPRDKSERVILENSSERLAHCLLNLVMSDLTVSSAP